MTDQFDRASEIEAAQRDNALQEQQRRAGLAGKTLADSNWFCAVCDDAIPEARRLAVPGVQTCVSCQEDLERGLQGGRRP
jgi:phage/conjugal plasmid C-4 type zinc finger TraR family protein